MLLLYGLYSRTMSHAICTYKYHTGLQKDRFTALMQARNEYIILHGQDEVPHICDKCMRVFTLDDGTFRMSTITYSIQTAC